MNSILGPLVVATLALCVLSCGGSSGNNASDPDASVGLDERPANSICIAPPRPTIGASVATQDTFPAALGIRQPTKILQAPGDGSRWYVLQQGGLIKVFDTATPGGIRTYLDFSSKVIAEGESGMLGMAFHPNFPLTPEVFLFYSGRGSPLISTVSRLILDDTDAPAQTVEQVLVTVNKATLIHNGGDIAFGPDGYLYIGLGDDGGNASNTSQPTTTLLGSMLRIDVASVAWPSPGYRIPPDNPYAANPKCGPDNNLASCPEIYAWGFRNPWRWSFDRQTGQLWLADVGENTWEEVDVVQRGGNYGWRCREGFHDYDISGPCPADLVDPVAEYSHADGDTAITGGFVYRGTAIPELSGRYVFSDSASGRLFALKDDGHGSFTIEVIGDTPYSITAFGEDSSGELYITDNSFTQRLHRIVPTGPGTADTISNNLADTGCVDQANLTQPPRNLIPYGTNGSFWSDGAAKNRAFALPDGATIAVDSQTERWTLPPGSVVMKDFWLGGKPVETRLLMRHPDGIWAGYTYEWNDSGTQAERVRGGKRKDIQGQTWIYPSEGQCMQCHTSAAGFTLGLRTAQLNGDITYAATGRTGNQLSTLGAIAVLSPPLPSDTLTLPALPDPDDQSAPLNDRARAYLDVNCSQCHQPNGPTPSSMDFRYETPLSQTNACNVEPASGTFGLSQARLISPGDASGSIVIVRASRRDAQQMPPLGSTLVDAAGMALLSDWVNGLSSCD